MFAGSGGAPKVMKRSERHQGLSKIIMGITAVLLTVQ
jgi:hypothetical protein